MRLEKGLLLEFFLVGESGVRGISCVVTLFLRCWLIYSLTMTDDGGEYVLMILEVISGHDVRKLESIALHSVDSAELHSVVAIIASGGAYAAWFEIYLTGDDVLI